MGRRGTKPTPTTLKVLRGAQPCRINRNEPQVPAGEPKAPAYLDKVGKQEWKRMAPLLTKMGVLTLADGAALGVLCDSFSRWREAADKLQTEGPVVKTQLGGTKTTPWFVVAKDAREQYVRLLGEFGCTPSARSRIKAGVEEPKDELGEFLEQRQA